MNWLNFLNLIHIIYGKGKPDIEKIQKMGLLSVKIGQIHALRIDFLNREKCEILSQLYRQNLTIPKEEFKALLENYSGKEFFEKFSYIEDKPLASASIGQIHKAKLKTGEDVVIKAIKKDFKKKFISDVKNLTKLLKLVIFLYPKLKKVANPIGILEDINTYTLDELDLQNEIQGQDTLKTIFEQNKNKFDLSKLQFAKIYKQLSNSNIMVSEYVEGKTFDELLTQKKLPYRKLLDLFHIHGFYMFIIGKFHGDIHPGNVILKEDKIYFVDTGYIASVGEKIKKGLFNFFEALSKYDYESCAYYLNKMSENEINSEKYQVYKKNFIELYSDFKDKTVAQVSLTTKMMQTIKLGVNSGMNFEKGIFPIIRSLMYMDGMVLKCNPDSILMKDMREFIYEFKKAMKTI